MEILSTAEMYAADQAAVAAGVKSLDLMENAGLAVANAIVARWDKRRVAVLCGPGNNGGDGFVVARLLKAAKWPVDIYLLGDKKALKGDAAANAKRWRGKVHPLDAVFERLVADEGAGVAGVEPLLVVDALFGAGLSKPLSGTARSVAEVLALARVGGADIDVVAVDVPSGVDGDAARPKGGTAFDADLTVTFCRPKPAHVLAPSRSLMGEVLVADIGIADDAVEAIGARAWLNDVDAWAGQWPLWGADANKYSRGFVTVLGGPVMSGAARLAALAARRAGAGLSAIAVDAETFARTAQAVEPGTLVAPCKGLKGFKALLGDRRRSTWILGPGAGVDKALRAKVLAALKAEKRCVLDADAITAFRGDAKTLFKALKHQEDNVVLTPHDGEFARLFAQAAQDRPKTGKLDAVRRAAREAGCVVLLKGADTTIAAPDGRATVATNLPWALATAGSGDVLAGIVAALLAQGMPAFEAASAAVWLHGECANAFGPGLIAEDLIDGLPAALDTLESLLD